MRAIIEKQGLNPPRVEEGKVHDIDPIGFLANVKVNTPADQLAVYSDISTTEDGDQKCAVLKLTCVEPDPDLSIGTISSETTILFIAENEHEEKKVWGRHALLSVTDHILLLMSELVSDYRTHSFEYLMRRNP